jgi:hypothetical protein
LYENALLPKPLSKATVIPPVAGIQKHAAFCARFYVSGEAFRHSVLHLPSHVHSLYSTMEVLTLADLVATFESFVWSLHCTEPPLYVATKHEHLHPPFYLAGKWLDETCCSMELLPEHVIDMGNVLERYRCFLAGWQHLPFPSDLERSEASQKAYKSGETTSLTSSTEVALQGQMYQYGLKVNPIWSAAEAGQFRAAAAYHTHSVSPAIKSAQTAVLLAAFLSGREEMLVDGETDYTPVRNIADRKLQVACPHWCVHSGCAATQLTRSLQFVHGASRQSHCSYGPAARRGGTRALAWQSPRQRLSDMAAQ